MLHERERARRFSRQINAIALLKLKFLANDGRIVTLCRGTFRAFSFEVKPARGWSNRLHATYRLPWTWKRSPFCDRGSLRRM